MNASINAGAIGGGDLCFFCFPFFFCFCSCLFMMVAGFLGDDGLLNWTYNCWDTEGGSLEMREPHSEEAGVDNPTAALGDVSGEFLAVLLKP